MRFEIQDERESNIEDNRRIILKLYSDSFEVYYNDKLIADFYIGDFVTKPYIKVHLNDKFKLVEWVADTVPLDNKILEISKSSEVKNLKFEVD